MASNKSATIPGLWADPHIAVFNNTYYIYPTKDGYPEDPESGKAYYAWKSTDLVHWERTERPLLLYNTGTLPANETLLPTGGNVTWAINDAWAPSVLEKDGTYYFYHSGFNPAYNERSIGVSTGPTPEGPFTPAQMPFITNIEPVFTNVAIDPHVFEDPVSGKSFIFWGNGRPQFAEMEDDLLSHRVATTKQLCGLTNYVEAPFMVYRKGLYHMTYSVNVTTSPVYRVGYATSKEIAGPFEYQGEILKSDASQRILGTGHNSIVNVPGTDDWYIAYHRFAPSSNSTVLRREIMIDRMYFDADTGLIQEVVPTLNGVQGP
ncbi:unnamed protein product [Discula destructiva]